MSAAETDSHHLLPAELRAQALAFQRWLGAVSDSRPSHCPDCNNSQRTIRCAAGPRCRRTLYSCIACGKTYNVLTGTPLAGLHHPHLWGRYMALRFAGRAFRSAIEGLGISLHAACTWDRKFLDAMAERAPELHQWWSAHQYHGDRGMPDHFQEQCDAFVAWVANMALTRGRLEGTPFHRLAFRPRWAPFARLLLTGASDVELATALAISTGCAGRWRECFQRALEQRHPDLLDWRRWQRTRRYNEACDWYAGMPARSRQLPAETCSAGRIEHQTLR